MFISHNKCKNCKCNTQKNKKKDIKKKPKRKSSPYNNHISVEMKKGKSMAEAAASWKAKKAQK